MDFTALMPWTIFGGITFAVWALMNQFAPKESRVSERLEELRNPLLREKARGSSKGGMGSMIEKAAPALSKALQPKTELEQNDLKVRLANAGFNSPTAPQIFLAIKFSMLIGGALLGGGFGMLRYGATQAGFTTIGLAAGAGFYLAGIGLWYLRRKRMQEIFLSLPDALDLLVVCVEAGLGLDSAMRRVGDELKDTHKALCEEINMCNLQLQMGRSKRDVLHDFGVRTGVDDVKALVAILIQADRFGSSIAQALRVQSDSMRVKRRQIAEEKAQKTAVQMLFPMVIFIFPGIFVVLVGPAAIKMIDQLL